MPLNKPTISHQLKTVKSHRKASKTSAIIHSMPSVAFSPQTRSHLITTTNNNNDNKSKQNTAFNNSRNAIDSFNCMSSMQLKECTKLLRNVLTSEALIQQQLVQHKKNKSTSTDDFSSHKLVNTRSVAFKPTDLSSDDNNQQQIQASDLLDDRTDAESLSSAPEQRSTLINNNPIHQIATHSPLSNTYPNYCNCHSNNNNNPMHDSRLVHNSPDPPRLHEKISVCMRCHNVILPKYPTRDQDTADGFSKKTTEDCAPIKSSIGDQQYHGNVSFSSNRSDFKPQSQYHDVSCTDKFDDFLSFIHVKINELQSVARVTRDADLGRIICEIERAFQQIARENSTLTNHLKTITKTLKWENSALKQKMKNQTESNRDMKSELKLIRQEQKQKVEELKLEVQLKTEEIRHLTDRDKNNTSQLKEKCATLEKEHEKLRCEFQSQILQACHKDTEMIQLKHSCSQSEAKLKEEIHSLTLANQNLKQELNICQTQCRKYEQDINHNQSIIKAAREQVFSLLDRHKQNRVENSLSYRYDSPCDTAGSGEWIHQATNLQHVLSMAYDNKDKQSPLLVDRYKSLATVNIPSNYYSPNPNPDPNLSDQSNITNASNNNFATTNFNNNYMSSSSYNNVHSDSTNSAFIYESGISNKKSDFIDSLDRSQSPSNISSTLSNHSLNLSLPNNGNAGVDSTKKRSSGSSSRRNSESSNSDVVVDPWSLPQPFNLKKMSSVSSMMSTVSSLRSTDDREFRVGLKRLDTQISRLQNTLQSNLKCK